MQKLMNLKKQNWEKSNKFLAELLLVPNANKLNTNRGVLWCAHFSQAPVLNNEDENGNFNGESPLVFSGFENQVGHYSSGYEKAKDDCEIIGKFTRNKYNYVLLVETKDGYYDIVTRNENKWLTEKYGYKYRNRIDEKDIGDTIKKDEILYANTSYDDDMNLCYGRNIPTIYMSYKDLTHEDAVIVSETGRKLLSYYYVDKPNINVNMNDILLNTYGDDENYKAFPDIGEYVIDKELCKERRIVYDRIITDLKDLKEYRQGDVVKTSNGIVTDIHVYCNTDYEKYRDIPYYKQIVKYLDMEKEYNEDIVNSLTDIIYNETEKCSSELIRFYNDAKKALDPNAYYEYQGKRFDNVFIQFTVMDLQQATIGSKITGRYGNKGCISKFIPDNEMPVIQSGRLKGKRPHIIMNPLGITGRMNPCCLQEQELNFVGLYERDYLKNDCKTLQAKIDDLIEYYEVVSPHQVDNLVNFIETHMDEQVEKLIQEYIETGIPIHQGPFYPNNDIYDMAKIYEYMENKLGLDDLSCKFEGIHEKLVIGEMYFVILKHNYSNKSSARSTSFNDLKDLPAKDKKYKENESIISTTPIKIGEMERTVLQAGIGNEKYVKELYYSHSTNYEDRENFEEELLTGNPFKTEFELSGTESNAVEVLKQLMYCSGVEFEDDDNENNEEVELYVEE